MYRDSRNEVTQVAEKKEGESEIREEEKEMAECRNAIHLLNLEPTQRSHSE